MEESNMETTNVQQVDVDLDEIFNGAPGASSVTLPSTEETSEKPKPNVFSRNAEVDLGFLEPKENEDTKDESSKEVDTEAKTEEGTTEIADKGVETRPTDTETSKTDTVSESEIDEILNEGLEVAEDEDEKSTAKGRKRINDMSDVFKKMIENDEIIPFDDDKDLEEYTAKDWKELIKANMDERANKVRRETPKQFFDSLPQELQVAAKYVADGGQDLKGLFATLSQVEETRSLDMSTEKGQEHIVREYLTATGYGNVEEVNEEIEIWKDLGKLEKQATKFKPKLDKMSEAVVAKKLEEQEMKRAQQQKASENYMANVYHTLKDGKLGDMKVNKKTQSMLYNGLVSPSYPSISGENTNLLGHLLEKYQFVEPNYNLVSEALWLLADPEGYKSQLKTQGTNAAVEQTVRKLKTAQASKNASSSKTGGEKSSSRGSKRTLPRNNNIFKRF
tara:strand:- start:720 stop:2063 length:1344 start_codon:yes stop_codon:yes gene_type:complete